jgi:hypothetical protein
VSMLATVAIAATRAAHAAAGVPIPEASPGR